MSPKDSFQTNIWILNRSDIEFIQEKIMALRKNDSISRLRFLNPNLHLDFHIIPNVLWTTDYGFRVDVPKSLLQSDASLASLLKLLLASAVIHRLTLAKEPSMDPSMQNAIITLVKTKSSNIDLMLQLLTDDERWPLYWIKRSIEVVNIGYPHPAPKRIECRSLNFHPINCIQFSQSCRDDTADFDELQYSFMFQLFGHELTQVSRSLCDAIPKHPDKSIEVDDINTKHSKQGFAPEPSRNEGHDTKIKSVDRLKMVLQMIAHDLANVESMHNLPQIHCTTGKCPDISGQVMSNIYEGCLNAQTPMESGTYGSLCEAFVIAGHFDFAIHCCLRAFSIGETGAKETWARLIQTFEKIAQSYTESGNVWDALELYRSVLELKRALLGFDHITTADTLNNMGIALQRMREYDEAISCLNQALHIYESKPLCEIDQAKLANTLQNLGIVYSEQGNQGPAIAYFKQALRFANCDLVLRGIINNLGVAFARKGLLAEAVAFCRSALRASSSNHGCHDLDVADILYNIGVAEVNIGRTNSGKKHLRKSNRIFNNGLGERHFKSVRTQNLLRLLQRRARLRRSRKSRK